MHASYIAELDDLIERGSPGKRATTLERMTAFFLDGASRFNDDHVRLFDLVFSRLIGKIETAARTELSRRLAPVGKAPIETVRRLAHDDDIAVAGPLLERADRLSDADLADIAESKGQAHLLAICARARIAQPVTDVLLRRGDREVVHSVAENRGARLSDEGFCTLVERAKTDGVLAEKVLLRSDIPPRLFHALLLTATDAVQRRLIASAMPETSSEVRRALAKVSNEVAKSEVAKSEVATSPAPRDYSRARHTIEALQREGKLDEANLVDFAQKSQYGETVAALALLCATPIEVVDRLMNAERPDPVLILCKSAGWVWSTVKAVIMARPGGARTSSQDLDAIHAEFDRLSPNTAQHVVRFWQVRADDKGRTTRDVPT
ncbi:MAG: DUF2336 domain-containing protein [Hyphomicrobiales bacterium]|nr:DUF2336 domain-containing protein [Hyphomicrobiales bacterium]